MDLEKIRSHRDLEASDFKTIAQNARLINAINKQTKMLETKMDTLIELIKKEQSDDKGANPK